MKGSNMIEPSMEEILERATYYHKYSREYLINLINYIMSPYDMCRGHVRDAIHSTAKCPNRDALTKPEAILLLLKLTEQEYEAIKTLPHDQLPLHINDDFLYPDIKALLDKRLKSG